MSNLYQVTFELHYPGAKKDVRTAFVRADRFQQAAAKVESKFKGDYESASIVAIALCDENKITVIP